MTKKPSASYDFTDETNWREPPVKPASWPPAGMFIMCATVGAYVAFIVAAWLLYHAIEFGCWLVTGA